MGTRWRGLLAPINQPTGDGRRMAPGAFTHRPLPLPLKWQRTDEGGHDTSVVIGLMDELSIDETGEQVWGDGELFDDVSPTTNPRLAEDVAEAKFLLGKKAIGPSVDPGAAQAITVLAGTDEELTEAEFERAFLRGDGKPPPTEILFTSYEIAAATLVPVPAFAECRPFELLSDIPALTAAQVYTQGWNTLPIASREQPWDGAAAGGRLAEMCGVNGDSPDWVCYSDGFLYRYVDRDPETQGAYGFPIVDVIGGAKTIVPKAVYAVAAALQGARGGTNIPPEAQKIMKTVVSKIYRRLAKELDDPTINAPWDNAKAAIVAAAGLPPLDAAMFVDPKLDRITPITERDLGNGWTEVYGHIATHDVCLVGVRDMCTTAPYSDQEYGAFHRYSQTDGGIELPVPAGRITAAHGALTSVCRCCPGNDDHACNLLSFGGAVAHHDLMRVLAYVGAGEDEANNAIWVHGIRAPEADERDRKLLRRQKVSGDWRDVGGNMELVEVLALSREKPGFPLPRVAMEGGRQRALTAAGAIRPKSGVPGGQPLQGVSGSELDYGRLGTAIAVALTGLASGITAAVRTSGWSALPLAEDGRTWDVNAAKQHLDAWADDDISGKYAHAFLWRDGNADPDLKGSYKIPIADVIDGRLTIVPNAVRNASSRLPQSDIPADEQKSIRAVLDTLFDRIHKQAGTRSTVVAAAAHAGAMVALRMTDEDAARLATEDGLPSEELHLTLAYLGDAEDIPADVRARMLTDAATLAAKYGRSLVADGFSLNAFNPGDANERDTALVLGVSGDHLQDMHDAVIGFGWEMPEQHSPFVPHVTLQYTDDLSRVEELADRVGPITFDRLRLAFGGEVHDIPLGSPPDSGAPAEMSVGAGTEAAIADMCDKPGCDKVGDCVSCADCGLAKQAADLAARIGSAAAAVRAQRAADLAADINALSAI